MSDEMLKGLGKPFPPEAIQHRQGARNSSLSYVATHSVIHRLNDVAGAWDFSIKNVEYVEWPDVDRNQKPITARLAIVTGSLTIPGLGTRDGIGVQRWDPAKSEDLLKGAASDAMKKAATLFGVALELYGEDYEDADAPQQAAKPREAAQPQRPPQAPQRPVQAPQQASPEPVVDAERKALYDLAREHGITSKSALAKFLYLTPEQYALQTTASLFTRLQAALKATSTTTPSSEAEQAQFDEAPR